MDLEMEDLFDESFSVEELDIDYEFDAPKYYDFLRPEADFEAQEAELWFESSRNYSPSPHIIKLDRRPNAPSESPSCSSADRADENVYNIGGKTCSSVDYMTNKVDDFNTGLKSRTHTNQNVVKAKAKSAVKSSLSKSSRFMKPTASRLAKLNQLPEICCPRFCGSPQNVSAKDENSSQGSSVTGLLTSKRQKLESGYLRKVARLKHQAILLHKAPKMAEHPDASLALGRSKVTIPREPMLETAYRAQRHRFKLNVHSVENENPNACTFRERPLNKKILGPPLTTSRKKSTPQMPEFQAFHLRTSKRAVQHASHNAANFFNSSPSWQDDTRDSRRMNSVTVLNERLEAPEKFKAHCVGKKESNLATDERTVNELPIESFSKLSLGSKFHSKAKSQSRMPLYSKHFHGLKSRPLKRIQQALCVLSKEMMRTAKSERVRGNCCQCGNNRGIPSGGTQINITRSLDMR